MFLDDKDNVVEHSRAQHYAWELGDRRKPPSLLSWCAFYSEKHQLDMSTSPQQIQKLVESFCSYGIYGNWKNAVFAFQLLCLSARAGIPALDSKEAQETIESFSHTPNEMQEAVKSLFSN